MDVFDAVDDADVDGAVAPMGQHGAIDVREHHEPALTDLFFESTCEITRAAGDVERPLTRSQVGLRERELLPDPMQASRHQIVHQVVFGGHRVENAANALRLVAPGDFFETEVGGFAVVFDGHATNSAGPAIVAA